MAGGPLAARARLLGWAVVGGPLLWLPFTLPWGGGPGRGVWGWHGAKGRPKEQGSERQPGGGPTPFFCQRGDPLTPPPFSISPLPQMRSQLHSSELRALQTRPRQLPWQSPHPRPLYHSPPLQLPRIPGLPRTRAAARSLGPTQPEPEINGLSFLYLASSGTCFQVRPCLTSSETLSQIPPPRRVGALCT